MRRGDKVLKALKRENERLRKLLSRFEDLSLYEGEAPSDEVSDRSDQELAQKKKSTGARRCPECDEQLDRLPLGQFNYDFCSCGYRKKVT